MILNDSPVLCVFERWNYNFVWLGKKLSFSPRRKFSINQRYLTSVCLLFAGPNYLFLFEVHHLTTPFSCCSILDTNSIYNNHFCLFLWQNKRRVRQITSSGYTWEIFTIWSKYSYSAMWSPTHIQVTSKFFLNIYFF